MANLDYFRGSSVGGCSPQNHWPGESGCAQELDHIAAAPQFVSRIFGAHLSGFGHAATASITAIDERMGLHLSSRKPACFSSARHSGNVRSRPVTVSIMLRSVSGANP